MFSEVPFLSMSFYYFSQKRKIILAWTPFSNFKIWDRILNNVKSK